MINKWDKSNTWKQGDKSSFIFSVDEMRKFNLLNYDRECFMFKDTSLFYIGQDLYIN